jgi:hypothetical protein
MIQLGVFEDKKKGEFGVYVKALSDQHLEPFKRFLGLAPDVTKAKVKSGKIASYKSQKTAISFANGLSNDKIMSYLTDGRTVIKYLALRDTPQSTGVKVVLNCQYYELLNSKGQHKASSIYYHDLEKLGRYSGSEYSIRPTVVRQWTFDKCQFPEILERVHVVDKQAKGIVGMMLPVHQIRRTRLVNKTDGSVADRHSAYAKTTSVSYYK